MAFIVGLVDSIRARRGHRWALTGVVAGIACWIGPIIQQFTARQGNLTALIESQGRGGPKGGAVFGLKTLAASVQTPPAWWTRLDLLPGLGWIEERSAAAGVIVLVLTVAALVVAVRPLRSRPAAMLAAVSLVASAAALVTFSDIPTLSINVRSTSVNSLNYLMAPMLAVGVLAWLAVGSVLVLGGTRILRMAYARRAMPGDRDTGPAPAVGAAWARWAVPAGAVTAAALVTLASFASFGAAKVRHTGSEMLNDSIVSIVGVASRKIEARLPHQLISLRFQGGDKHYRRRLAFGLVYALQSVGYRTEVMANYAWQLGPTYAFEPTHKVRVTVTMAAGSGVSVSVKTFGHGQEAGVARVSHG